MSRHADLLIVGAGIHGATAAYEAACRGLSLVLVDRGDFGAGSSANSMKIAHGGLRYLQRLDLCRSLESIRERRRLLQLAPRWVRPLRCRLEVAAESPLYRWAFRSGLLLNEILSLHRNLGVSQTQRLPLVGFPNWYDAIIEDTERVLLGFIHGAIEANPGAVEVVNHASVEELTRRNGRIVGARIEGLGEIEAGCVLNCTGAARSLEPPILSMNLLVDPLPMSADGCAVGIRHPDNGRNVFVVPWRGRSIVGTYDRAYPYPVADPLRFERDWITEFLTWLEPVHPQLAAIDLRDVRFVHAGVLAGSASGSGRPAEKSRVVRLGDGEVVVQGTKWTTAYGVSASAVALAVSALGGRARGAVQRPRPTRLPDTAERVEAYLGSSAELAAPVLPNRHPLRRGEVLFGVEHEWARRLDDVLLRRTGAASAGHPGIPLVEAVATLMQATLDWSDAERRSQVEAFHEDFHFAGNVPK